MKTGKAKTWKKEENNTFQKNNSLLLLGESQRVLSSYESGLSSDERPSDFPWFALFCFIPGIHYNRYDAPHFANTCVTACYWAACPDLAFASSA